MNTEKKSFSMKHLLYCVFGGVLVTYLAAYLIMDIFPILVTVVAYFPLEKLYQATIGAFLGSAASEAGLTYYQFILPWISIVVALLIAKSWRPYLKCFGTKPRGNRISMLLLGLLIGFVMNGVCILAASLTGSLPAMTFMQFEPLKLLILLVLVFVQSACEEAIGRCFIYQRLLHTCGLPVAIIGNAVFFAMMHLGNDGITKLALLNIFLVGVFFSLLVYYCDSLWIAMAIHTAWNFTQNFIFGLPNSGLESMYCIFKPNGVCSAGFAYDTVFGVEGSWSCTIVMLAAVVLTVLWGRKHPGTHFEVYEAQAPAAEAASNQ